MRSKTYMSKINLQSGILTVENRRSREKKRICSEVGLGKQSGESGESVQDAVNGGAKCRKWGSLGQLGALKVIGNVTIRCSAYDFLFDFNRNHASILYRFRDIAAVICGKSPILTHPTCIRCPRWG